MPALLEEISDKKAGAQWLLLAERQNGRGRGALPSVLPAANTQPERFRIRYVV